MSTQNAVATKSLTYAVVYTPDTEPVYHPVRRPNRMSRVGSHPPTRDLSILILKETPNPGYVPGTNTPQYIYTPSEVWIRNGLNFFSAADWAKIEKHPVVTSRRDQGSRTSIHVYASDVPGSQYGDIRDFSPDLVKVLAEYVQSVAVLTEWRQQRLPSDVDETIKARILEIQEPR